MIWREKKYINIFSSSLITFWIESHIPFWKLFDWVQMIVSSIPQLFWFLKHSNPTYVNKSITYPLFINRESSSQNLFLASTFFWRHSFLFHLLQKHLQIHQIGPFWHRCFHKGWVRKNCENHFLKVEIVLGGGRPIQVSRPVLKKYFKAFLSCIRKHMYA